MKIAIITGGTSGERDISIKSAENISGIIDFAETEVFVFPEQQQDFVARSASFDVAIPIIHGEGGEDGTLQIFLRTLGIPFIFSDPEAHAKAINKRETKLLVREIGIHSAREHKGFPAFVKPNTGGSSVASKLCHSEQDFNELKKQNPDTDFLIEEPIKGREFTVGILEHKGSTSSLSVIEIIPKKEFFDFESKYDKKMLAQEICPAKIDQSLAAELQQQALAIHKHLNCRHISRSDFIVKPSGEIFFLEINTIPGLTATSLIPKMLQEAQISLKEIFQEWCLEQKKP